MRVKIRTARIWPVDSTQTGINQPAPPPAELLPTSLSPTKQRTASDATTTTSSSSQDEKNVLKPVTFKRVRLETPKITSSSAMYYNPAATASSSTSLNPATFSDIFTIEPCHHHQDDAAGTPTMDDSTTTPSDDENSDDDEEDDDDVVNTVRSSMQQHDTSEMSIVAESNTPLGMPSEIISKPPPEEEQQEPDIVLPPVSNSQDGFSRLLAYYIRWLQRHDKNKFFHYPVLPAQAPDYKSKIQTPMDFETMSDKLLGKNNGQQQQQRYAYISQFMADFHLLCWNALQYNKPGTLIYREAKKLLNSGKRVFNRAKIDRLKRNKQFVYIHAIELGRLNFHRYDLNAKHPYKPQLPGVGGGSLIGVAGIGGGSASGSSGGGTSDNNKKSLLDARSSSHQVINPFEPFPDNMTPEQILQQVRAKAQQAAHAVRQMPVQTRFGFIESYDAGGSDGAEASVVLRIVNPDSSDETKSTPSRLERVPLGVLAGRIPTSSQTSHEQASFFNPSPVTGFYRHFPQPSQAAHEALFSTFYSNYNAYSSAMPYFDRRESIFTRDELCELRSVYRSDRGMQYCEAMLRFAQQTHPRVRQIISRHLQKMTTKSLTRHTELVARLGERLQQRRQQTDAEIRKKAAATVKCDRLLDAPPMSPEETKLLAQLSTAATQAESERAGFAAAAAKLTETTSSSDVNSFIDKLLLEHDEQCQDSETTNGDSTLLLSDADVQTALDLNAEVLFALYMQQTARMTDSNHHDSDNNSAAVSTTMPLRNAVPFSTELERELAELSVNLFKKLVKRASPADVVSVQALRQAMGLPADQQLGAKAMMLMQPPYHQQQQQVQQQPLSLATDARGTSMIDDTGSQPAV